MTPVVNQHPAMPPEAAAAQHVLQLATGHIVASALSVALELRLADHLSAPRASADLANVLGVQEGPLYRVMRVLASVGVFKETSPRAFEATPASDMMRSTMQGTPYAIARLLCDSKHFLVYSELMESVKTGKPALEKVFGAQALEVFERDRE